MDYSYRLRIRVHRLRHGRHVRFVRHFLLRLVLRFGIRHGFRERLGHRHDVSVDELPILQRQLQLSGIQRFVFVRIVFRHGIFRLGIFRHGIVLHRIDWQLQQFGDDRHNGILIARHDERHSLIQASSQCRALRGVVLSDLPATGTAPAPFTKSQAMQAVIKLLLSMGLLFSHEAAMADIIVSGSAVSLSSSPSGTSSEASFTGNDGRHNVNGDIVEVRHGRLTVNGEPYGTVGPESFIRYRIRGDKKTLIVDGKVRPLRK